MSYSKLYKVDLIGKNIHQHNFTKLCEAIEKSHEELKLVNFSYCNLNQNQINSIKHFKIQ